MVVRFWEFGICINAVSDVFKSVSVRSGAGYEELSCFSGFFGKASGNSMSNAEYPAPVT